MNIVKRRLMWGMVPVLVLGLLIPAISMAAEAGEEKEVRNFPDVVRRAVTFWSDGTRLAGDLTYPKDRDEGDTLPALILCHGWGGMKAHLNQAIAPQFAAAGYMVMTFDYRGWGGSDSRLVVNGKIPKAGEDGMVSVSAQAITQLVAPFDQQLDIAAAISFIEGEPGVDRNRIGLWGSSFGGGHVMYRAAHDDRVKCIVSQVSPMDLVGVIEGFFEELNLDFDKIKEERIQRARGDISSVPQKDHLIEGLTGTPEIAQFLDFVALDHTDKVKIPVLIIDAEQEHYFDIEKQGGRAYEQLKGRVPVEYHVLKDTPHYAVYSGEGLKKVMGLEIAWFNTHLKGE